MNKQCIGCGAILQSENKTAVGYIPNIEKNICQRCYRIKHYDDLVLDLKEAIDPYEVLKEVNKLDGLICWIVDLYDISGSVKLPINRYVNNKDIVFVGTKRDLLPETMSNDKLKKYLYSQLKENGITVKSIAVLANKATDGIDGLKDIIKAHKSNKVILMGNANSGKSTLLNALIDQDVTISAYPGTTVGINRYENHGLIVYDTPGLKNTGSILQHIDIKCLHQILPKKLKKIRNFQIYQDQSFAIGGLVRLDLLNVKLATVTFYISNDLEIHRGKTENADKLWTNHYGVLLNPIIGKYQEMKKSHFTKKEDKIDIVINGLGFISINGDVKNIEVTVNNNIDVTFRKGIL